MKKEFLEIYVYPVLIFLSLFYLLAYLYILFFIGNFVFPSLEELFIVFLGFAILSGSVSRILFSWGPFVLLFIAFQALRGVADNLNENVNYLLPIEFENYFFNGILTNHLQNFVFNLTPDLAMLIIYFSVAIYSLHFIAPMIFAYFSWNKNPNIFIEFMISFTLLSYAGLVTFLFLPTAPPWIASLDGYIPQISHILLETDSITFFGLLYFIINPNHVAAIPSLHAAYPLLITLFIIKLYGKKAFPIFMFPIIMGVILIFLGEHYLLDILIGFVYALIAFYLAPILFNIILNKKKSITRKTK
ncbi:MAG: phosphatase PAP2 family protein [Candidatus ainarchaeum sp.]|nr:phosphatase PAP2 family protein [Candidatus ainarchaeum sp.]